MIREIIRLKIKGLSNSMISQSLKRSRSTIVKYVSSIDASGFDKSELLKLTDLDLSDLFETTNSLDSTVSDRELVHKVLHDYFPYVDRELKRVGVTRQILWKEYKEKHPEGVMYSQFCEHYAAWNKKSEGYMPNEHKAGDKMFVDYAGKKLHITDKGTGEIVPVEVFVAILGASQYTFVEASLTQQVPDFLNSLQNSMSFFGGVPVAIVPDNLKSAVIKSDRYEPFINEELADFSFHYDTTVLPARPRKPKDKSLVEGAVNITYTRIYAALRDKTFYSLEDLNLAIRELLVPYNQTPFQKKPFSREELFNQVEKPELKSLPVFRYELKEYKYATVQKNCHVHYTKDNNYYSVPHAYIGKKVKLILSLTSVDIYHNSTRIAMHPRNRRPHAYTTIKEHMPSNHKYQSEWTPDFFIKKADAIGYAVCEYIRKILQLKQHPEQSYKSCQGILSFENKVGKTRLNKACKLALEHNMIGYSHLKNILVNNMDKQTDQATLFTFPKIQHENIRGAEYYNN